MMDFRAAQAMIAPCPGLEVTLGYSGIMSRHAVFCLAQIA
jgi:hypothetical protein